MSVHKSRAVALAAVVAFGLGSGAHAEETLRALSMFPKPVAYT